MAARRKKRKPNLLVRLFVLGFVVFTSLSLITMQLEVANKRRELEQLQRSIQQQELMNADTRRLLGDGTDLDYIERIARDKLGYVYPDEKVFIDRSGS